MRLSNARVDPESLADAFSASLASTPEASHSPRIATGRALVVYDQPSRPSRGTMPYAMVVVAAVGLILVPSALINDVPSPPLVPSSRQAMNEPASAPATGGTADPSAYTGDSVLILPPLEPVLWRRAIDQLGPSPLTVASALPEPNLAPPDRDQPAANNAPSVTTTPVEPALQVAQAPSNMGTDKPDPSLLVIYGNEYLSRSDVTAARLFYRRAADGGSANGAAALAASYDPVFLQQRAGLRGVRPDPEEALRWYRVAMKMGDPSANTRVTALIDWLRSAASRGDEKARALLEKIPG